MGGCVSRRQPSAVDAADTIQVVHHNGHVQLFSAPITAHQVAGKRAPAAEYFICTAAMLVAAAGAPAMSPDADLQPGKVYFMLPISTLHPGVSPADLASIAKRLNAAAKSAAKTGVSRPSMVAGGGELKAAAASGSAARSRQWRPVLDTIKEKPMIISNNQSDFEDKHNNLYVYETNYHE